MKRNLFILALSALFSTLFYSCEANAPEIDPIRTRDRELRDLSSEQRDALNYYNYIEVHFAIRDFPDGHGNMMPDTAFECVVYRYAAIDGPCAADYSQALAKQLDDDGVHFVTAFWKGSQAYSNNAWLTYEYLQTHGFETIAVTIDRLPTETF